MREHQLQLLARKAGKGAKYEPAAFAGTTEEAVALSEADELASQFHSHAIEIEEIVHKTRTDLGAALEQRFTPDSIRFVQTTYHQ